MNHRQVRRLYHAEGLMLRRKRVAQARRVSLPPVQDLNERWSMDSMGDSLADARSVRTLNIVDDFSREAPTFVVDPSLPGRRVVRELETVGGQRGWPKMIAINSGPEFASQALDEWAYRRGVKLHFIRPGQAGRECLCGELQRSFATSV